MANSHTVTADQVRDLWNRDTGPLDRGDDLPPVTRADVETLISSGALSPGDRLDDGTPADHMWSVLADQFNNTEFVPTQAQEEVAHHLLQCADRLDDDPDDPDNLQKFNAAVREAAASGVPRGHISGLTGGRVHPDEVKHYTRG